MSHAFCISTVKTMSVSDTGRKKCLVRRKEIFFMNRKLLECKRIYHILSYYFNNHILFRSTNLKDICLLF